MKDNFNDCLARVFKDEGGYSDDPSDSGGATKYGITITDVRKYIKQDATSNDVRNLTLNQARQIYKKRYWDALDCDNLPSGLDYTVFDYGIHSGLGRPRKALQRFKSLKGTELIDAINNERTAFLKALAASRPKDQKYLRGWLNRVSRVNAYSKKLAGQKDNSTGPASGGLTGLTIFGMLQNFAHIHPYLSVAIAVGAGAAIWALVHYIRNKDVKN